MQVRHRLSGVGSAVGDDAVAAAELFLLGYLTNGAQAVQRRCLVSVVYRADGGNVLLRYYQYMHGSLRRYVAEDENVLILIYLI